MSLVACSEGVPEDFLWTCLNLAREPEATAQGAERVELNVRGVFPHTFKSKRLEGVRSEQSKRRGYGLCS